MIKKTFGISDALISLRPGSQWSLVGEEYTGINWMDKVNDIPSKEEIDDEILRLQTEYDALEYQRLRAAEYPPIVDQLDDIFHNGVEGWKQSIQAVKDKYPKLS